jgi:hypothetical protein
MGGLLILGVLIAWFMTAKWLAGQATQRMTAGAPRFLTKAVLTAVVFVAPVIDEIIGAYQFEALCKEGGIYQIAPEAEGKKFDLKMTASPYKKLEGYARPVYERTIVYRDLATGSVVATSKAYAAQGGWLVRTIGFSTSSTNGPLIGRDQCIFPAREEARLREITKHTAE